MRPLDLLSRVACERSLTLHWRARCSTTHVKVALWVNVIGTDIIGTTYARIGPVAELEQICDALAGDACSYWAWRGAKGLTTDYGMP